jgi:uncharacterized protein (DUF1015 family)
MPLVKPFPGLLYADTRSESLARVLAPPFDMIGPADQERLFAESEHSIAWLTVACWGADPGYREAAARLAAWRARGVFARDAEPAFYVYEQTLGRVNPLLPPETQPSRLRGFIAAVRLEDAEGPGVYPHENTFEGPIRDRVDLIRATGCHLEPVFGLYTDDSDRTAPALGRATHGAPLWETVLGEASTHRLWRLTDPTQQAVLRDILTERPVVIADGHHRFAGAKAYRDERRAEGGTDPDAPYEYTLMLLTDTESSGLTCGAYHRLVKALPPGVDAARLADALGPDFDLADFAPLASDEDSVRALLARLADEGRSGPLFACVSGERVSLVRPRNLPELLRAAVPPMAPDTQAFDVAILHRLILKPRLGLTGDYGPEARNVLFEHDPLAAWRAARSGEVALAWFVNPADIHSVLRTALAHHRVPQKATYFYPKPPSGMVIYPLGD